MAKKPKDISFTIGGLLQSTASILKNTNKDDSAPYIPSIIEFCENPNYLGLEFLPNPIRLYPIQKLVLRAFYRGTPGNTSPGSMKMTPEEIALCEHHGLNSEHNGDILRKWNTKELFKEMVLVWGRRSGKDFTISILALYEAMRLLEAPGGDPYRIYELGNANPFTILTIAGSKEQARILYREIHGKLLVAPYFQNKFIPEGITADRICLLTPADIRENERRKAAKLTLHPGSVVIEAGHSNSNTLVGKSCYALLLDEVGTYKQTAGAGSGDQIYGNLSPTTKTYVRKEPVYNEKGEVVDIKRHYDGKVISISSPRGMDGKFYDLYSKGDGVPQRLVCRLPTWVVNTNHTEKSLRDDEQTMTEEKFMMEYGAEFSGTEGENFFAPGSIEGCFKDHHYSLREIGEPGITYFAHLDPAISNHNYALAIVHKEYYMDRETRKVDFKVILDYMKLWKPEKGKPINIGKIDEEMIRLNRLFHFGMVTYDQWNSQSSIENLRKAGIPAICTRFNKQYKIQIYEELEHLVNDGKLKLPFHQTLRLEMLHLQRKYMNQGYRIYPKSEGEVRTDDCCDALAGACFNTMKTEAQRLPMSKLVNMGVVPSASGHMWRSMQGTPMGYGSGQSVAANLERGPHPYRRS